MNDEARIRSHYQAITAALLQRDPKAAMAGYAQDTVVFDISPPMAVAGRGNSQKTYEAAFAATEGPWSAEWSNLKITIEGQYAFVTAFLRQSFTMKGGQRVSMRVRLTDILKKSGGEWEVAHEHISVPVDMRTGVANFDAPESGDGQPFQSA